MLDSVVKLAREARKILLSTAFKQHAIHRLLAIAFGEILLQRPVVKRLAASAFEPGNVLGILDALQ